MFNRRIKKQISKGIIHGKQTYFLHRSQLYMLSPVDKEKKVVMQLLRAHNSDMNTFPSHAERSQ